MKRLLVLLFSFIIFSIGPPISAQVELGIHAGTQFGDVSIDPSEEDLETSLKAGFMFGGVLNFNFTPMLGLQIQPSYVQKKVAVYIETFDNSDFIEAEGSINADYFDIPVLFKVTLAKGPVKPYLMTGITLAFLLGDNTLELDKVIVNGVDVTKLIPSDEKEEKLDTKSTDFILNFGGGLIIPVGQFSLFIEGQYNLGLANVNDDPDDDATIKTSGIQIKAGALFTL